MFSAYKGKEALKIINREDIQLFLMDIMMPEMDGIEAMCKIREISNVPVILLTAKSEDTDKVLGLTVGADDYVTKPFNPVELQARVKSQIRRYMLLGSGQKVRTKLSAGGIELDDKLKEVTLDGEPVNLTNFVVKSHELAVLLPEHFFNKCVFLLVPGREIVEHKPAGIPGVRIKAPERVIQVIFAYQAAHACHPLQVWFLHESTPLAY